MNRKWFNLILKFLHFNNNKGPTFDQNDDNRDRLHKVGPLIKIFCDRAKLVYSPGKNLSVDESLILFNGRLQYKQYIKTNCARFGIKLYELCFSDSITLDFLFYCGKGMFHADDPTFDMPTAERIRAVLMESCLGKGYSLFTNNFYSSPSLAKFFLDNKTHLAGTIRVSPYNFSKDHEWAIGKRSCSLLYKHRQSNDCL